MPDTIVVVEDDPQLRFLAGALLEETGLSVVECVTAAEGLRYISDHASEVKFLLTDIETPGPIDGVALASEAVHICPAACVVVTSGNSLSRPLPAGVKFIRKPWLPLDLLVEVERHIA